MRKYQKAVQITPFWPDFLDRIGFCLINLGEFEQAIAFFQKAIDCHTDDAEAYIIL